VYGYFGQSYIADEGGKEKREKKREREREGRDCGVCSWMGARIGGK